MDETSERPGRRRRRWPLYLLLTLAAVSLLLHATQYLRGKDIAARQRQYSELVRSRPIAATKARRARYYQRRYFLALPMAVSYATADFVRRVEAVAPPLRLLAVQVDPGLHDLGFELTVETAGSGPRTARRQLAVFLERLRTVPGITLADHSGLGPAARSRGARIFTVNGRVELQP
jgi:hypothetical protein